MSYNQEKRFKINGVWTSPNQFSEVPEGALLRADNLNILRDSVITTRRGFVQYGVPIPSAGGSILSIYSYADVLLAWTDNAKLWRDNGNGASWADLGTVNLPDASIDGGRIRTFEQNKNLYLTTDEGVKKLAGPSSSLSPAGVPPALSGTAALTGSSGFLPDDKAVAYKVVWGYKDASGNLILGAPCDRIVIANTVGGGATRNVLLTFAIPAGGQITTSYFYQVYRSGLSATASDPPEDNYQQVYEANPSSFDIAARTVTITDIIPDSLRQALLYTSANAEQATAANYPPPFCKDACSYKNFAFYANTREKHTFDVTLLAVGASSGIQDNDTITFTSGMATFTITGKTSAPGAGQFLISTGGTVAENNEATARAIVYLINLYASNTFLNAYYTSGYDDLPGQMTFDLRSFSTTAFRMTSSRITCWDKAIPTSGATSINTSTNNEYPNRIYVSKLQQPEAVPLLNNYNLGSAREPIIRIITLRDSVMVFKTDGVFAITGDDLSNFRTNTLDNTSKLIAPNSAVPMNNTVYYFNERGISSIGPDGSNLIVSTPIKKDLITLSSNIYTNFKELTNAISYESQALYILGCPTTTSDIIANQQYIYSDEVSAPGAEVWTRWTREYNVGLVNPVDDKLYLGGDYVGDINGAQIVVERKSLNLTDYADEQYDRTIVSQAGLVLTMASTDNLVDGMTIQQGATTALIATVDNAGSTVTLEELDEFVAGPATFYTPINTFLRTTQLSAGEPGLLKHTPEISLFFEEPAFSGLSVTFVSDYSYASTAQTIVPDRIGGWGTFNWGSQPWGGSVIPLQRIRVGIAKEQQRVNWLIVELNLRECFTSFGLVGLTTLFVVQGHRQKN